MNLTDFNYELPHELIARYPLEKRSASRLLCLNKKTQTIEHKHFFEIIDFLSPKDLLICNNSKVIPARLFGKKETGGHVEVLIERILDSKHALAHVRASKSPKPNSLLFFAKDIHFKVLGRQNDLFELMCNDARSIVKVLEEIGQVPLPPYFQREAEESDKIRYQTIYAEHEGSVAAPTAGLHFDENLFAAIKAKGIAIDYVTLHVGSGTFAPVRCDDITQHKMHSEYVEVSEQLCEKIRKTKEQGGKIIAVGTTAARSLETASLSGKIKPFSGDTNIFIYPGFKFNCVDNLITNFHLPESTLLMLVSALAGFENIKQAYQKAIEEKYRFFSYGDAMFIYE